MIVARGLGRGAALGALVAFGLTLDGQAPPPAPTPIYGGQHLEKRRIDRIHRDDEEVLAALAVFLSTIT
jgi:hypothetical protein